LDLDSFRKSRAAQKVGTEQSSVSFAEYRWECRPWYNKASKEKESRFVDMEQQQHEQVSEDDARAYSLDEVLEAKRAVAIEEEKQLQVSKKDAQDQSSVPDTWEHADLDAIDYVLEAKRANIEAEKQLQVSKEDARDQSSAPDTWKHADLDALEEVLEAKRADIEDEECLQVSEQDMQDQSSVTDSREAPAELSGDTETRAMPLAYFLAGVGPQFDVAFMAKNFGTDSLEEIMTQFVDLDDFQPLVVAGMKPLHKNKLFMALDVERKRRVRRR